MSISVFVLLTVLVHWAIYAALLPRTKSSKRVVVALACLVPLARFVPGLSLLGWIWAGFAIHLLLAIGSVALVTLPARRRFSAERRQLMTRALAPVALGVAGYGVFKAYEPAEIVEVPLRIEKFPKILSGFRMVQLTDVHVGNVIERPFLLDVVDRVNKLKPDLVVITGDLVDGKVEKLGETVATLRDLRARYGTRFVTGNHDYYSGAVAWCEALAKMGIDPMRNQREVIEGFDLIGVDDWRGDYDLKKATLDRDPDHASILLAHQPSGLDAMAAAGIDLQISGHTHGGQLFPLTQLVQLAYPRSRGLYTIGRSRLYVSRGVGFWGPPMRIGSPPEITVFSLSA